MHEKFKDVHEELKAMKRKELVQRRLNDLVGKALEADEGVQKRKNTMQNWDKALGGVRDIVKKKLEAETRKKAKEEASEWKLKIGN